MWLDVRALMSTNETRIQLLSEYGNSWNYLVSYLTLHLPFLTLPYVLPHFTLPYIIPYKCLKICTKYSQKLERNIFSILRNFRKINNLKLPQCFSIIFPELIQNLLKFSRDFVKISKHFQKIISKSSQNFQHFSKIFRKYSKVCFPKLTNVHIFSKFFKRWNTKSTWR